MKNLMKSAVLLLLVSGFVATATAQQTDKGDKGGKGDKHGKGGHGNDHGKGGYGKHGGRGSLQALSEFKGTVTDFVFNDDKVYDGISLNLNGLNTLIKFPPHLGKDLMATAKKGLQVSVMGFKKVNRAGVEEIILNSLTANGKTVYNTRPEHRDKDAEAEVVVNVDGKITSLSKDKEGKTNGVFIDKTLVRFPANVGFQLSDKLVVGSAFSAAGAEKKDRAGEVRAEALKIIKARTITLNGISYLVQ